MSHDKVAGNNSIIEQVQFVFAISSGHFRINDFLPIFNPLLLLNYFLFNLFFILAKKWVG